MHEYIRYYHGDRTHLGLSKETPAGREGAKGTAANATVKFIRGLLLHRDSA